MKRITYNIIIALSLAVAATSCKKDLAALNISPNATSNPQPDYLLTASQKISSDLYWGADNNFNSSLLIVQHWAKIQYPEPDRYIFSNSSFTSLWNTGYSQSITDLNTIIQLPEEKTNANYKGVALVLRSWVFSLLTDAYGSIPYKQAGKIQQTATPAYDTQKDVYYALLDDLKTAITTLNASGPSIAGDIIYSGNISSWKKFANALRLRIALRIADKESDKAKQVITEVLADNSGLIASNAEIAKFTYSTSPQQNPMSAWFDTREDFRVSKTLVDKLKSLNDPRLPVFASKPTDATVNDYVGVSNGLNGSDGGLSKTSRPGAYFLAPTSPSVIISYAEVLFDRAEAAARGYTSENAEALYKQAITASLTQYSITDLTTISNYLGQASVQYDATNFKKSIGEQKWIALYGQGLEAFAEWRRLDYPQLNPSASNVTNNQIPVRFIYPGSEQTLNSINYKSAVSVQGTDNLLTKLWFDAY